MHLLATQPGTIADGTDAVDLGQTPGDVLVLSAADSEIACLAGAQRMLCEREPDWPSLRLASLLRLTHNYSVDLHVENVAAKARLVVVRVLGGRGYWPYGVERLAAFARAGGQKLALLPGDDQPDAELAALSTVPPASLHRLWRYLAEGGGANAEQFLRYAASLIGRDTPWREPQPLMRAGLYWPGEGAADFDSIARRWRAGGPVAALVFYRALVQAAKSRAGRRSRCGAGVARPQSAAALRGEPQGRAERCLHRRRFCPRASPRSSSTRPASRSLRPGGTRTDPSAPTRRCCR